MNFALMGQMFWEFMKIGLFAVGGGPATLPYLMDLTKKFDWYTMEDRSEERRVGKECM